MEDMLHLARLTMEMMSFKRARRDHFDTPDINQRNGTPSVLGDGAGSRRWWKVSLGIITDSRTCGASVWSSGETIEDTR